MFFRDDVPLGVAQTARQPTHAVGGGGGVSADGGGGVGGGGVSGDGQ